MDSPSFVQSFTDIILQLLDIVNLFNALIQLLNAADIAFI